MLKENHPSVFAEFVRGTFVVQKMQHLISLIALDHNHEEENEIVKGDGAAVGLTENPNAHQRWMVAGPEVTKPCDKRYHEQMLSLQKAFF